MFSKANFFKRVKKILKFLPDKQYIKLYFELHLHRKLDLNNPKTLNEKLQWMKFNYRFPLQTVVSDKILVRKYVEEKIGSTYLIPCYGVWDNVDDIGFNNLPDKFVLKCNHDSGGIVICRDKEKLNINRAKRKLRRSLKINFYYIGREYQYKNIKPRILCEQYISDGNYVPIDYKIYCFNGVPDSILVCTDRFSGDANKASYNFFDEDWNFLPYNNGDSIDDSPNIKKPENLKEMLDIARKLSEDFIFARIDLYDINGSIYFGEITLSPNSGFDPDISYDTDLRFGKKLQIPHIDKNGDYC